MEVSPPSSGKGHCSAPQLHGASTAAGSCWQAQPQGVGATVGRGGTLNLLKAFLLGQAAAPARTILASRFVLGAGQAVTYCFWKTLMFFTGQVPPAPEQAPPHPAFGFKSQKNAGKFIEAQCCPYPFVFLWSTLLGIYKMVIILF